MTARPPAGGRVLHRGARCPYCRTPRPAGQHSCRLCRGTAVVVADTRLTAQQAEAIDRFDELMAAWSRSGTGGEPPPVPNPSAWTHLSREG